MDLVRRERSGAVAILTLSRGKANALNAAMVEELLQALSEAEADAGVHALVVASASPKLFSAGFDVNEVFAYDEPTMTAFFGRFLDLLETLRCSPRPSVAALSGHTYAGGALVALACDFRVMADADCGFALNEVNLGVTLPERVIAAMSHAVGVRAMRRLLMSGDVLGPAEAFGLGLVDELAPAAGTLERALARARGLSDKPPLAMGGHKRALTLPAMTRAERETAVAEFMRSWFGDEGRARRTDLVDSLKRRR